MYHLPTLLLYVHIAINHSRCSAPYLTALKFLSGQSGGARAAWLHQCFGVNLLCTTPCECMYVCMYVYANFKWILKNLTPRGKPPTTSDSNLNLQNNLDKSFLFRNNAHRTELSPPPNAADTAHCDRVACKLSLSTAAGTPSHDTLCPSVPTRTG